MIMNWNEFVMTEEFTASIVSMFTNLLENERAIHATTGVDLKGDVIKILRRTFSVLADLSCNSEEVKLMG